MEQEEDDKAQCCPEWDIYSERLINLKYRWVMSSSFVLLDGVNVSQVADENPLRMFLGIYNSSAIPMGVSPVRSHLASSLVIPIGTDCCPFERCLNCHGPLVASPWFARSTVLGLIYVVQGIYRGYPERCKP